MDPRRFFLLVTSAVVLIGTAYSLIYNTFLDTSNPLLTHLPHHLGTSHYFANKSNVLNVYFIKRAWGWTTAVFFFSFLTSPPPARTIQRLYKWVALTIVWLLFTSWFFGPALFERVILASGGECVVSLPSGDYISVPHQFCHARDSVSPQTHPEFFATTSSSSTPFADPEWQVVPRLRKGHDVSGHIFLLTMSILFLADELRPSLRFKRWSTLHNFAIGVHLSLILTWLFASCTTSVYYHAPFEKFTGLLLGVAGFALTQLPVFDDTRTVIRNSPQRSD